MATEVRSWKANDGSLHENECAAATRDVELIVERSPLAENTPFARKLVDWLTGNAALIRETLEAHERACPKAVAAAPAADDYANPAHDLHAIYREGWHEKPKARNPYNSEVAEFPAWAAGHNDHHLNGNPLPAIDWDDSVVQPREKQHGR